jgi:hypothetical protein
LRAVPAEKIIKNAERPRRKDNAQPDDNSLQRLPECGGPCHRAEHYKNHGRKRQEHVESDRLRQRNATWNDTEQGAVESV